MKTFFRYLKTAETAATISAMVAFTVVGFLQVFFRVFLKHPLSWSEEACRYLFLWSMMLGAILVSSENGHFRVDFLVIKFPKAIQKALQYFGYVLVAVFSAIIVYYGYRLMVSNTTRISPALGIKMMYVYLIFPINGILVLLHLIEAVVNDFSGAKEG